MIKYNKITNNMILTSNFQLTRESKKSLKFLHFKPDLGRSGFLFFRKIMNPVRHLNILLEQNMSCEGLKNHYDKNNAKNV